MRFYFLFASILALLPLCLQAQISEFSQGVSQLDSGRFAEAQVEFEKALTQEPNNEKILFNLGLTAFKQNKKARAAAYWRKALAQSPQLESAKKGMALLEKDLVVNADEPSLILQAQNFSGSLSWPLFLSVVFVVLNLLGYFGFQKNAPAIWILSVFALVLITIGLFKQIDATTSRATVIENEKLKAGPDQSAPQILEIAETQEVILLQTHEDWVQIQLGHDTFGWLPKKSLFQTKGPPLW